MISLIVQIRRMTSLRQQRIEVCSLSAMAFGHSMASRKNSETVCMPGDHIYQRPEFGVSACGQVR